MTSIRFAACGILAACLATAPALSQTDTSRILQRIRNGNTTAPNALPTPVPTDRAIEAAPIPVTLKKSMGSKKAFEIFPARVVVAGYNVGGFRSAKTTGRASGGVFNSNPGAATTVELVAWGIDPPLLTRIANAAYADLLTQLKAAGFDVITLEQAQQAAGYDKLKLGGEPYDVEVPADRGNMKGVVVGPSLTGTRMSWPLAKTEFGSFGAPELSLTLESMVIMPNLMFDFASLRSSRSVGYTASASANLNFDIAQIYSQFRVMASKRKQFLEGDFIFTVDQTTMPDTPIGTIADSTQTNNMDQQLLGRSLGLGVQARSRESSVVQIDQPRYEALALAAAKGYNAAFVAQLRTMTGR